MRVVIFLLIAVIVSPAVTFLIMGAVKYPDTPLLQWALMSAVVLYCILISFIAMLLGRKVFTEMTNM